MMMMLNVIFVPAMQVTAKIFLLVLVHLLFRAEPIQDYTVIDRDSPLSRKMLI